MAEIPTGALIVRDEKDYPDADQARASLPEMYAEYPYAGVWLQDGDPPEYPMYVFTTVDKQVLVDLRWEFKHD